MQKLILKIDGMMCGMCESHVNDAIRSRFAVKKVSSSHTRGTCEIISQDEINPEEARAAVEKTGYRVLDCKSEQCSGAGLFSRLFKK